MELVIFQIKGLEIAASPQSHRNVSLERVQAQVQQTKPHEMTKLGRYLAGEAVVAKVQLSQER